MSETARRGRVYLVNEVNLVTRDDKNTTRLGRIIFHSKQQKVLQYGIIKF